MINSKRSTENSSTENKSTWNNQKAKLRREFPSLTDEDVNFDFERKHEMLGKLSIKLNKTTPELATILERK